MTDAIGPLLPAHDRALRTLKALSEGRWRDARDNALAMPEDVPLDRAWKVFLLGRVAFETGELSPAGTFFRRCAALALEIGLQADPASGPQAMRLAATALEQEGCAQRRGEHVNEAVRAHQAALELRREHGSLDEQWESAFDLALDFEIGRRFDDARRWLEAALGLAERSALQKARVQSRLASVLLQMKRFEEAVVAARKAHDLFIRHDAGAIEVFLAQAEVGYVLLRLAESVLESDPKRAAVLLADSTAHLTSVRDELRPFGIEGDAAVNRCTELLDFAQRLSAMAG